MFTYPGIDQPAVNDVELAVKVLQAKVYIVNLVPATGISLAE